jgi:hypothetical protein
MNGILVGFQSKAIRFEVPRVVLNSCSIINTYNTPSFYPLQILRFTAAEIDGSLKICNSLSVLLALYDSTKPLEMDWWRNLHRIIST